MGVEIGVGAGFVNGGWSRRRNGVEIGVGAGGVGAVQKQHIDWFRRHEAYLEIFFATSGCLQLCDDGLSVRLNSKMCAVGSKSGLTGGADSGRKTIVCVCAVVGPSKFGGRGDNRACTDGQIGGCDTETEHLMTVIEAGDIYG